MKRKRNVCPCCHAEPQFSESCYYCNDSGLDDPYDEDDTMVEDKEQIEWAERQYEINQDYQGRYSSNQNNKQTGPGIICNYCDGTGIVYEKDKRDTCPSCNGQGFFYEQNKPA